MDIPYNLYYNPFKKSKRSQSSFKDIFNDLYSKPTIFSDNDENSTWEGFSSLIYVLFICISPICISLIQMSSICRLPSSMPLLSTI